MQNTSQGVHTFSFFQRLKEDEYFILISDFEKFINGKGEIKHQPIKDKNDPKKIIGWIYTYKNGKGIRWVLHSTKVSHELTIYVIMAIITPKVLIESNYIAVANVRDLEQVEDLFNKEAEKISPILNKFGFCSMNRADPSLTIDLEELKYPCSSEQLMILIKRGDIPKHFVERMEYKDNDKSHRKKADKYSHYLENDSVVINYYWKYPQINEKHPEFVNKEKFRNVIRLETECKYRKLYSISKSLNRNSRYCMSYDDIPVNELLEMAENNTCNPSIPIDVMLSDDVSANVIRSYFNKVIRQGDYLTLDGARWMVSAHNFRRDKEDRLIFALEIINECRSIAKAKKKLHGEEIKEFKRSLNDLDAILVNPVTIPREWKVDYIPNPLRAYYNHITEEQLVPKIEVLFDNLLAEYLLETKGHKADS
jgi:hypothetical protein